MNRLSIEERARIVGMLIEGNSLRSVTRMTGASINTVTKLLVDAGSVSADYQDKTLVNLKCKRVQCDEIWAFCYAKQKNVPEAKRGQFGFGDVWTWTAIDADTKLVPSFLVGNRDVRSAHMFMQDLAARISSRIQLTTDGLRAYLVAVQGAFGLDVDFATLHKLYGAPSESEGGRRYSPPVCIGCKVSTVTGSPDPDHISTSYVERQNLTMRMGMRRFTRLTNAFSKKVENHAYQVALHFMHYNFARIHKTLRVTPAMEAGLSNHVWSLEEIADLIPQPTFGERGPYQRNSN